MKDRPDLHVVARFLDALVTGSRSRSRLQRTVGVNYDIFRRYETLLMDGGYLEVQGKTVELTLEGHRLHGELAAWLERLFQG